MQGLSLLFLRVSLLVGRPCSGSWRCHTVGSKRVGERHIEGWDGWREPDTGVPADSRASEYAGSARRGGRLFSTATLSDEPDRRGVGWPVRRSRAPGPRI